MAAPCLTDLAPELMVTLLTTTPLRSQDLACLAVAAPRFGLDRCITDDSDDSDGAPSNEPRTIAEEVGRRLLARLPAYVRAWLPPRPSEEEGSHSLYRLNAAEQALVPLRFTNWQNGAALSAVGDLVAMDPADLSHWGSPRAGGVAHLAKTAVCAGGPAMVAGIHYAEFTTEFAGSASSHCVGVVHAAFQSSEQPAHASSQAWMLNTRNDGLAQGTQPTVFGPSEQMLVYPQWKRRGEGFQPGDVIGLLLDIERRTLTVFQNGNRLGLLVYPGISHEYGMQVGQLAAPLHWAVDIEQQHKLRPAKRSISEGLIPSAPGHRYSVRVDGPLPPRQLTAEEQGQEEREISELKAAGDWTDWTPDQRLPDESEASYMVRKMMMAPLSEAQIRSLTGS
jgi:hypothetical protein